MKTTIMNIIAILFGCTSTALAASGAENDGTGLLFWAFIGLGFIVVVFQFLPGTLMFFGMFKGIFSSTASQSTTAQEMKKG